MDLGLSEQQELLRRTARDFLESQCPVSLVRELEGSPEGYSPALWKKMADLGWLGLAIPSEYGGEDGELLGEVMTIIEVAKTGKAFTRPSLYGRYLYFHFEQGCGCFLAKVPIEDPPELNTYVPSLRDILANDWEIEVDNEPI